MKKVLFSFFVFLIFILLKSCTYSLNIDTKLFASGIGIDINDEGDFYVSLSYPDISEFSPESSKIKSSGSISGFGKTFYEAVEDIIFKSNKTIDLEHIKVVTISNKILSNSDNLKKILDYLSHNPQISRRVYVCVGDGDVDDFMNFKIESGEDTQFFISELLEYNSKENGTNLMTLNEMLSGFLQNKTLILPILKLNEEKTQMNISKSCILYNYKLIENINLEETMLLNFLRGDSLKISNDFIYNGFNLDFECQNITKKVKILDYGNVNVVLNFNLKTKIKNCLSAEHNVDDNFVDGIKNVLNKDININCMNLVDRFYKNGIDILNLENHIYKFKTNLWKDKIHNKEMWMDKLGVKININNHITNFGNVLF